MSLMLIAIHWMYLENTRFKIHPGHFNLEKASEYKSYTQVMAVFVDKGEHKNPYMRALGLIERYYQEAENLNFQTVLSKADLENGKIRTILGIEGGEALEGSETRLVEFFRLGVRIIGITWNTPNELCGTNTQEGIGTGLTEKGKTIIKKMEELGMMVDVSHMSEKGFYDVLELVKNPFVASHSNSKSICPAFTKSYR